LKFLNYLDAWQMAKRWKKPLYQHLVENAHFGNAKAPGVERSKTTPYYRILGRFRSFNPGALAQPKWAFSTRCWYIEAESAIESWIQTAKEFGDPVPDPSVSKRYSDP
jgi:hypothetical protein